MKKKAKKLVLAKETLQSLEERTLNAVAGGNDPDTSVIWRLCDATGLSCFDAC